jgi:hypothetical protein
VRGRMSSLIVAALLGSFALGIVLSRAYPAPNALASQPNTVWTIQVFYSPTNVSGTSAIDQANNFLLTLPLSCEVETQFQIGEPTFNNDFSQPYSIVYVTYRC